MSIELQFKIKSNPNYEKYLRENSHWYKYLNRSPKYFPMFESEMKERYHLRMSDRLSNFVDSLDLIQKFMSIL